MRYSRTGIIAVLIGAEVFIAGAILALLGGHMGPASARPQNVAFSAPVIDPIDPIEAGSAPKVQIDDADSTVTVGVSNDGTVRVVDESQGASMFGRPRFATLQVERTSDGVRIYRAQSSSWVMFGWSDQRIRVEVPAGATIQIAACSGADVTGITGGVQVHSDDGDVAVRDVQGDTNLSSADGSIEATAVRGSRLNASTDDGSLHLQDVAVDSIQASSDDGSIRAENLDAGAGSITTDDGSVNLGVSSRNLAIQAHTDDGSVTFDGRDVNQSGGDDDDSATANMHIGSGGGSLQVASSDGDIHIRTNGAQ